jgi:hypothetical protein
MSQDEGRMADDMQFQNGIHNISRSEMSQESRSRCCVFNEGLFVRYQCQCQIFAAGCQPKSRSVFRNAVSAIMNKSCLECKVASLNPDKCRRNTILRESGAKTRSNAVHVRRTPLLPHRHSKEVSQCVVCRSFPPVVLQCVIYPVRVLCLSLLIQC